jgi:hypothetical protein
MKTFGQDAMGTFKRLKNGRVLRIQKRMYNTLLTVSRTQDDFGYMEGW